MIKKFFILLAVSLLMASSSVYASVVDDLKFSGYIADKAEILNEETEKNLNEMLHDLAKKTSSVIAIVTVKSLDGESIDSANEKILETFAITDPETNKGLIFLIALDNRQLQVLLDKGLVGEVKPEDLKSIIDKNVIPFFQTSEYDKGIVRGTYLLAEKVAKINGQTIEYKAEVPKVQLSWAQVNKNWLWLLLIPVLGVIGGILAYHITRKNKNSNTDQEV